MTYSKVLRLVIIGSVIMIILSNAVTYNSHPILAFTETDESNQTLDDKPLKIMATLSPEPVVGQDVNWHIELLSGQSELPNTKLEIVLPDGVELVSGNLKWNGDIPANGKTLIDLEHISKMVSDENNNTSQMNESEVILKKSIIANQNATVVLQPSKQAFHFPSSAIAA